MNFYLEKQMKVIHLGIFLIWSQNTNLVFWCHGSSEESSGDEIHFKKRKEQKSSNTSKAFFETLTKAKSSTFACTSDMAVRNRMIQIKLNTSTGTFYDVEISENSSCSCSSFSNPCKTKHLCIHII